MLEKVRVTVSPKKNVRLPIDQFGFYMKYAFSVLNTLKRPSFQEFLSWVARKENIDEHKVKDVQIRMFPLRKENGGGLAGKCNSKGRILLFPKRIKYCQQKVKDLGTENLQSYIKSRARATLIHELLHIKYTGDEQQVRRLTERYFNILINNQDSQNFSVSRMLFTE